VAALSSLEEPSSRCGNENQNAEVVCQAAE
jgi:hypothetical protein